MNMLILLNKIYLFIYKTKFIIYTTKNAERQLFYVTGYLNEGDTDGL